MGRTGLQIIQDVAQRLGWRIPTTIEGTNLEADTRKLLNLLNQVIRALAGFNDWNFLRRDGELQTVAPHTTGLAVATKGSDSVTGLSTPAWTLDMKGRAFQIDGTNVIYRITDVPNSTTLTISRAYVDDDTGAAGKAYTIAQDRYELPTDFDRPVGDWSNFIVSPTIRPVDPTELMRRRRVRSNFMLLDEPHMFVCYEFDDEGQHRIVHFDPFPSKSRTIVFQYQGIHPEILTDAMKVRFPLRYDSLLMEAMIYLGRRDYEDDQRMTLSLQDFMREKNESLVHEELGQERMSISPSNSRRISENMKWSRGSVGGMRINWGSKFDELDRYLLGSW